jgi:polyferredoxin
MGFVFQTIGRGEFSYYLTIRGNIIVLVYIALVRAWCGVVVKALRY